jgi:hypothetical protein
VDTSIIVAIIALAASVVSAAIAYYAQTHTLRIQARREARATLQRYREPLLDAAYELQSRLYNILCLKFFETYYTGGDAWQREYAVKHTLFVVGQYFAWTEILRRRIQFLDFGKVKETREVAKLLDDVRGLFLSDENHHGKPFMIWIGEQRAIGERMIVRAGGDLRSMGYGAFIERKDPSAWKWFERLERDVHTIAEGEPNERLWELQHKLIDLINRLDPGAVRYPGRARGKADPDNRECAGQRDRALAAKAQSDRPSSR